MSVPRRFIDTSMCGALADGDAGVVGSEDQYTMRPSRPLSVDSPIRLVMTPFHQRTQMGLRRIGVMFDTWVRANPGDAELRLKGPRGATYVQRLPCLSWPTISIASSISTRSATRPGAHEANVS